MAYRAAMKFRIPTFVRPPRPYAATLLALTLAAGVQAQTTAVAPPLPAAHPAGAAAAPPPAAFPVPTTPPATPIAPQFEPRPGLRTGGAPTSAAAFRTLAAEGFHTYVDLRSDAEIPPETASLAAAAGVGYERVPVTGDGDLDLAAARRLQALLADPARRPMVVACHSGNRAGALLAVESFWLEGTSPADALALGRAAGLTKLEPSVRQLLGLPPLPPPAPATAAPAPPPQR